MVVLLLLIRWWLCQKTLQNFYEIDDQLKVSFNFGLVPHLYRCPDGYHFDITTRRCRRKESAKCGIDRPKPRFEELGLLQLLFPWPKKGPWSRDPRLHDVSMMKQNCFVIHHSKILCETWELVLEKYENTFI